MTENNQIITTHKGVNIYSDGDQVWANWKDSRNCSGCSFGHSLEFVIRQIDRFPPKVDNRSIYCKINGEPVRLA